MSRIYKSHRMHLVSLFLFVGLLWAPSAQAAVFGSQQVESLLQLLEAFHADASIMERVRQTLGGQAPATPTVPAVPASAVTSRLAGATSFSSPSWMKELIIYEMRLETFAEGATDGNYFAVATARLPELADLGITAVSINPIGQGQGPVPNLRYRVLYGPSQPDKLDPQLGTDADFARFVAEAHKLGIKVIVDNVVHGIVPSSPYVSGPNALPAHFFVRAADGSVVKTWWGTAQWNWSSVPLREWWVQNLGVAWVKKYDVDGFRLDLVPDISPIELWNEFKSGIARQTGKDIILIPEMSPTNRAPVFDVGQADTGNVHFKRADFYNGTANVVDTIKGSSYQFYTNQISSHDSKDYRAQGRLSAFAYGSVLSPYIPSWFMGEEFNAKADKGSIANTPEYVANGALYMSLLHWQEKAQNNGFYEQVKKLIQIRKEYADIIAPGETALKDTRITKVTRYAGVDLEPYSMWKGNTSITVVAKRATPAGSATFSIPVDVMGMRASSFKVTELLSGVSSEYSRAEVLQGISMDIPQGGVLVVKAEGVGELPAEEPKEEKPVAEKPAENGTIRTQNRLPSGYFERASCAAFDGWVVDPDSPNSIASVRIYKDGPSTSGTLLGTYPTSVVRDDVTAKSTTIPGLVVGKRGFSVPLSADLKDGATHRVYVYGVDNETGALRELEDGPRSVTCAPVVQQPAPVPTQDRAPHGYFDIANCSQLSGWAYDPDEPSASITVRLYEGSTFLGGFKADQSRSDVNRIVGIAGDHGFNIPVPENLKDGKPHALHFYGINTDAQGRHTALVYSPRTIVCAPVSSVPISLVAAAVTAPFSLVITLLANVLYAFGLY